jgi:hypothetical protein
MQAERVRTISQDQLIQAFVDRKHHCAVAASEKLWSVLRAPCLEPDSM